MMKSLEIVQLGAVALIFVAFFAPWIGLPFEAMQSGVDYVASSSKRDPSFGLHLMVMAFSLPLFMLAIFISKPMFNVIFSAVALSFCGAVIAQLMAKDGVSLPTYANDIEDYKALRNFFKTYFVPNNGYSLAVPAGDLFDGLISRLRMVFSVLEWGWYVSFVGCLGIYLVSLSRAHILIALTSVLIIVGPFILTTYNILQAAKHQNQAQNFLGSGDLPAAYDQLMAAFMLDPMLQYSQTSTRLLSQLSGRVKREEGPSSAIYRASALEAQGQRYKALEVLREALENAAEDDYFTLLDYRTKRELAALVNKLVRRHYRHEDYGKALHLISESLSYYPDSLVMRTLTSYSYLKQNLPVQCIAAVDEVLEQIGSKNLVADLLSTRGECLLLKGAAGEARRSFMESIEIDGVRNLRAVRGLSGT